MLTRMWTHSSLDRNLSSQAPAPVRLRWVALLLIALGLISVPGCNTMKGVGTDIHDAAQNTQDFLQGNSKN